MNARIKSLLKYVLSLSLAGMLLYFCFRGMDWEAFLDGLKQTDWRWVILSMLLSVSSISMRGLRWHQLVSPLDPSARRWKCIAAVSVGNLSSCVIPGSCDFVRSGLLSSPGARFDKVLGTVALERAWDLAILGLVFLLILLFDWGGAGLFLRNRLGKPALARLDGRIWLLAVALVVLVAAALWLIWALRKRSRLCGRICNVVRSLLQGFLSFRKIDRKGLFLAYSVGIWAAYWLMCVCILHAFPPTRSLTLLDGLFLMAAGSLQSMIPAPGGFGTYHYVIALCLSGLYGFPWETGILFATISHESQALTLILTGLAGYVALAANRKRSPGEAV